MGSPIVERWWPVTYDHGLIHADADALLAARRDMYATAGMEVSATRLERPLEDCFAELEPLSSAPTRELFLRLPLGWTAFFQNGFRGSSPGLPMRQMSTALGVTAMRVCVTPRTATYPAVIWEVYDTPDAGGDRYGYRRSIAAANDGGRWNFEERGEPFPFEDLRHYGARRKRDRFTPEMLAEYLAVLGIPPLTDECARRRRRLHGFPAVAAAARASAILHTGPADVRLTRGSRPG